MSPSLLDKPGRTFLGGEEREAFENAGGMVIADDRRTRPRYFDGRFLAARDLTADQRYASTRQADLGRAIGSGVVTGLRVRAPDDAPTSLTISAGYALTPSGEVTVLRQDTTVDVFDLARSQLLDGHLGLRESERTAVSSSRRGAFVLALRPVSYSANPRRGYPTSVHGERRTEDHDWVDATAITLVPWPTSHAGGPEAVRRQLAREIFVRQQGQGLVADLVPLAVVYLDSVAVSWVDEHLVRRPVGSDRADPFGLGLIRRGVRAAHVRQFTAHLQERLAAGGLPAAADAFDALPSCGPLPVSSIDPQRFSQSFFPAECDVDLSFVPRDELPTLLDQGLDLAPIDLGAGSEALAGTSLLVLVPVERSLFRRFEATLSQVRRPLARRVSRLPVKRSPLLALSRLKLPSVLEAIDQASPATTETAAWTKLFDQAISAPDFGSLLWWVQRRNLDHRVDVTGQVVAIDVDDLP